MARVSRGLVLAVLGGLAVLALVTVLVLRDSSTRSTTGRVVEVGDHRLCVTVDGGRRCAQVDRPPLVAGVRAGDCVSFRSSADDVVDSVEPAETC
jgi:hypothetical protein